MRPALRSVAALLVGVFVTMAGSGPLGNAVSLQMEAAEPSRPIIGHVMSVYVTGLTLGSLLAFRVVRWPCPPTAVPDERRARRKAFQTWQHDICTR